MYKLYKQYENIWKCFNPSTKLNNMIKKVEKHLTNYNYNIDEYGNIFIGDFTKHRPCLVAHLDSVHEKRSKHFTLKKGKLFSENGIGGDDKCGIIAILEILSRNKNINAIFLIDEEIGGIGADKLDVKVLDNVLYFIEIDRAGNKDIIYNSGFNQIASDDFINVLEPLAKKHGYKENFGTFTDVNILTQKTKKSAINISAGYYNAHTKNEYVKLNDLQKTIEFVEEIIHNINDVFIWEKTKIEYNINDSEIEKLLEEAYFLGCSQLMIDLILEAYEIGMNEAIHNY